jgi:endonuclease YncB( thermonuclease family)
MNKRFIVPLAAALVSVVAPSSARAAEVASCDSAASRENVRMASVGERLDIVLADGRMIYFPTLEPPRATPAAPERAKNVAAELTSLLAGKSLMVKKLGGPDRWGRIPALLFVEGEAESADEILAGAGLAMASGESGACGKSVLAAEAAARAERLGIWADPDFVVLPAEDSQKISARAGALTLVEGRVASFGHTAPRLYLNFGSERGGFSLTIARRNLALFERAGLGEKNLLHKWIRARGVVEMGAAPQIELFHPDQIEVMEDRH